MRTLPVIEYIHEGNLVGEVDVTSIETDSEWSPYFAIQDASEVLKKGDLETARTLGRVYEMRPIAAE